MQAVAAGLILLLSLFGMSGCGRTDRDRGGPPTVVASTDVWGSVAKSVAGDDARVSSILNGASADPHSFEASPSDAAALIDASIVVYNGGDYDPWVDEVLDSHRDIPAVNAYSLLDATAVEEPQPANEHVFYDLLTAKAVADDLAAKLAAADPGNADRYRARAKDFSSRADKIRAAEEAVRHEHPGAAVVATEPVAHYLLKAAGLADKTPTGFSSAVEQDTDPAPADVAAVLDLIKGHDVAAVVFNDQTVTPATQRVRDAARNAGVPVVSVTETLPPGSDYLAWQSDTVDRLAKALRAGR
jgi:zinc/manganese transport system substrate-binding protein